MNHVVQRWLKWINGEQVVTHRVFHFQKDREKTFCSRKLEDGHPKEPLLEKPEKGERRLFGVSSMCRLCIRALKPRRTKESV